MKKKLFALLFCLLFTAAPAYAAEDAAALEPPQDAEVLQASDNADAPADAEHPEDAQSTEIPEMTDAPKETEGAESPDEEPEGAAIPNDKENEGEKVSPFSQVLLYEGAFSDLAEEDRHFESVAALYGYGFAKGRGDGTFGVNDDVTVAEVLTFAARIRSTYDLGDAEAGAASVELSEDAPWYAGYAAYLRAAGVIADEFEGLYETAATRAQAAYVLANVLDASWFDARNAAVVNEGYATRQYITDVDDYTAYQQEILTLYRRGIVQGFDEKGSFLPDEPITRGEIAAMFTRIIDPALRINIVWIILPR